MATHFELPDIRFKAGLEELRNIFSVIDEFYLLGDPFFKVYDSLVNDEAIIKTVNEKDFDLQRNPPIFQIDIARMVDQKLHLLDFIFQFISDDLHSCLGMSLEH